MGTNEKSGQSAQKPAHSPGEHFAARRKILGGLAGAPVFLTFSPHAGAQAIESFARCVNNELPAQYTPTTDLSQFYYSVDQNSEITTLYSDMATDGTCDTEVAMLSAVCLASFVAGGTLPTQVCTPPPPPAASSAAAAASTPTAASSAAAASTSTAASSITAPPVKKFP